MSSIDDLKTAVSSRLGMARSNSYLVMLPLIGDDSPLSALGLGQLIPSVPGVTETLPDKRELNILCKNVSLPGKQILTHDKRIGMEFEKVAYGYAVSEVTMNFFVLNDYGIINYLNAWRGRTINENFHAAQYKSVYQKPISVYQLRKPFVSDPGIQVGPVSLDLEVGGGKVYGVKLIDAFPTTVNQIDFSNELDGLIEVTVSFSYTNWIKEEVSLTDQFFNLGINI